MASFVWVEKLHVGVSYHIILKCKNTMKLELFSCPFFIGNIDLKQIKLDAPKGKAFLSKTPSSFNEDVHFPQESVDYLYLVIGDLLKEKYEGFTISLQGIWKNEYVDNDFQEPHIHAGHIFSFIIYEEVTDCHTIFFNPAKYLIPETMHAEQIFIPQIRKGQIIIFPSYVEHMVNRNSDQVTISGNLNFKHEHIVKEPKQTPISEAPRVPTNFGGFKPHNT